MSGGKYCGPSGIRDARCSTSSPTPSPVLADTGKYSDSSSSAAAASWRSTWSGLTASILFTTSTASFGTRSATQRSPRPIGWVASIMNTTTSTSGMADWAVTFRRSPSGVRGLWMPGVSTNTICTSGRVSTPWMRWRVVCGLSETIATFRPRMRLSSVDLPTFGRPTIDTNPERYGCPPSGAPSRGASSAGASRSGASASSGASPVCRSSASLTTATVTGTGAGASRPGHRACGSRHRPVASEVGVGQVEERVLAAEQPPRRLPALDLPEVAHPHRLAPRHARAAADRVAQLLRRAVGPDDQPADDAERGVPVPLVVLAGEALGRLVAEGGVAEADELGGRLVAVVEQHLRRRRIEAVAG